MGEEHKLCPPSICFILKSSNHTITIGYDPVKKTWQWIDASAATEIKDDKDIANRAMNALSQSNIGKVITFSTSIFVETSQHKKTTQYLASLNENLDWQALHNITTEKAKITDSTKASWLHIAAQDNHEKEIKSLLAAGANPNNICINKSATPLCVSAQAGHIKAVTLLLADKYTNPNLAIESGETPLFVAAQNGHQEIVELLLTNERTNPNLASDTGETPLIMAIANGHDKVVASLLADKFKRINPNLAFMDSSTPLIIAAQTGNDKIVTLLLADTPRTDSTLTKKDGTTALHYAAQNGHSKIVELLLANGALPNQSNGNGMMPLHLAALKGHIQIAEKLLDAKADIDATWAIPFVMHISFRSIVSQSCRWAFIYF